ncbi:hypothetical protein D9M73_90680 [compost metagenome]|nr:MAG TPA: Tetratricopeptide repeat [Caudoviricetes sp.]
MKKLCVVLSFPFLVSACATMSQKGLAQLEQGDPKTAVSTLRVAVSKGDMNAWNNLGVAYARLGDEVNAVEAFKMGARYGDTSAIANLKRRNLVPPLPELADKATSAPQRAPVANKDRSEDAAAVLNILDGLIQGRNAGLTSTPRTYFDAPAPAPAITPITCATRFEGISISPMASLRTTCQ